MIADRLPDGRNVIGQICPQFVVLWLLVVLAGIVLDDCLRFWLFEEKQPHYNIGLTRYRGRIIWFPT